MVRVSFFILLLILSLPGCAVEQPPPIASPPTQTNAPPGNDSISDCLRENSLRGFWSCSKRTNEE